MNRSSSKMTHAVKQIYMAAFIVVTPNHAFTRPAASGEFALPDLPPGSYQLHLWHPDLGEQTVVVELPASGDAVETLSF